MQISAVEKEKIFNDLLNITEILNDDILDDLYSACNNMRKIFQTTYFGDIELDKFQNFNNNAQCLKKDTITLCNKIREVMNSTNDDVNELDV